MQQYTAVVLLLLPCLLYGQLLELCDPDTFVNGRPTSPPLPTMVPSQLSATVEGNLLGRSETTVITEYYDQIGDRGRLELNINGTSTTGIFDYTLGEVFLFPDPRGGGDCSVFDISPQSPFVTMAFGFTEVNGSIHIGSPTAFLERILGRNATVYMGEDVRRGIPVQHWQSCVSLPNNTYLLDYYFASQANWSFADQVDPLIMIPIEFRLNASFLTRRGIDNAYNIYTFLNFKSGPDSVPDEVFQVPNGLACKGRAPGMPVPMLPDAFSSRIELLTNFQGSPVLVSLQEYYDLQRNLFRLDFYTMDGPTTLVHDFNQGVQYRIAQNTNQCQVSPLTNISGQVMFDFDLSSDLPSLGSPNQLALLDNFFNYSYEGVTTVRGVEVDAWSSIRDFERLPGNTNVTNALYEVFFTRPGITVVNEHSASTSSVILRIKLSGDFTSFFNNSYVTKTLALQWDFFDFTPGQPPYDAYEVSSCFPNEESVSVVMVIPTALTGFNIGTFKENIRAAISSFTGVAPLQVAAVHVLQDNGTHTFVHVHIANQTAYSTVPIQQRVTADAALQILVDGTAADTTSRFTMVVPPNITVSPSVHAAGSGRGSPSNCDIPTPATPVCPTGDSGDIQKLLNLKDREIIGIAIGLLFGGIILGGALALLILCICKCVCKGSGSYSVRRGVQYKKHDDDVAFPT